ncbi:MAG: NADH:ubiquinone reductase (Na(+)-transporting) subunit F [Gammaproteobacteria bacterium]
MSYEVVLESTGDVIDVEEGQTILDAALRAGVYLPHACGHGLCATCKIEILEGDVEQGDASPFALMDMEKEEGKCLACCAMPESDLVIEADIDEEPDAECHSVKDYVAVVSKIEDLTPRIKAIFLAIENSGIAFQAGQYVNLILPGLEDQPRAFSIANPTSVSNMIELNVSLVENGKGTTYIHDELKVGDELKLSGPYGRFFVRKSKPEPLLFLAGGSGLSSPKSMILDLLENNDERPITLIYGARDESQLYYRDLFEQLDKNNNNFTYIPALSNESEDSDWSGARGFVHEAAKEYFDGKFEGNKAYICGPPPMVDACINTLMQGRLFEKDMYMENFFTNDDKDSKTRSPLFKTI